MERRTDLCLSTSLDTKYFGNAKKCDHCGIEGKKSKNKWTIQWAVKKGVKLERSRDTFLQLCSQCHQIYDRESHCGTRNYFFGKHHSKRVRKILSDKAKKRLSIPANNGMYGKTHTKEVKERLSKLFTKHVFTLNGETRSLIEWSKLLGINENTIRARLKYGWNIEKILSQFRYNKN